MNRAIDNVIKKGKALKGSAEKLRGVKKQADALRGRMLKEDKGRLGKALSKPSVTDKRSRDYGGRLTKGARGQDPATGGKKSSARRADRAAAKPAAAKPAAARRADRAEANIPMKGRRGKQLDASISKAAKQVKAAETARLMKPKAQIKSERAAKAEAKRQVAAAKPKRVRSAESLRVSRAKRITKERSISLNPAGNTQKGAGRMAANAKKTQDRALAFYKGKAKPKDGTDITREIGRAKANKRIKNLNQQIKEAGTNAAGLRLEKLKVQTRMPNKPRQRLQPTAKQSAKEASRNDAIRKRSAELRAQSGRLQRNQANIQRLKNQSPKPGSRRLSSSQVRRQYRADIAKDIYSAPSAKRRAQIVGNQRGLAKTERAKNNSMRLRSDRLAEAKATGLSMIKVTRPAKPKRRRS